MTMVPKVSLVKRLGVFLLILLVPSFRLRRRRIVSQVLVTEITERQRPVVSRSSSPSIASSIANLANTNMGVGMLALPRAMASAGFFGGTALLLLSAVLSTFSSHLLAECVDGVGRPAALSRVTARALGRPGVVLTEAAVVIVGTSAAIGYLIVVGDMLPEVKRWVVGAAEPGSSGVWDSRELWICAALPVIVPLGYLRRLDSLRLRRIFFQPHLPVHVIHRLFVKTPKQKLQKCRTSL